MLSLSDLFPTVGKKSCCGAIVVELSQLGKIIGKTLGTTTLPSSSCLIYFGDQRLVHAQMHFRNLYASFGHDDVNYPD
jgi:predicted GNAT family N-acyltransferase